MWWSDLRRPPGRSFRTALTGALLLLAAAAGLSGCGFQPVYASRDGRPDIVAQLNQVQIDPLPDRNGQFLRNQLIDRFYHEGRPANPAWRLAITYQATEEALGIRKDATATRARVRVEANYELIDSKSGQVLYRTFSRAVVAYNILDAQYATMVAQQDAYDRALTELADDIRTRLGLYFMRDPKAG